MICLQTINFTSYKINLEFYKICKQKNLLDLQNVQNLRNVGLKFTRFTEIAKFTVFRKFSKRLFTKHIPVAQLLIKLVKQNKP